MGKKTASSIPERRRTALVIAPPRAGCDEIAETLLKEEFRVQTSHNVYDAVAAFADDPTKLIVLSLDGVALKDRRALHLFRRRAPDSRVLLLVPEGRRADVPAFLRAGADALLPAPASAPEIRLLVHAMLRGDAADPLTGLPNKEAYERAFDREASRAKRANVSLCLALLDLDKFGDVNEDPGYTGANRVLCEVADRLNDSFRNTDLVARWGGDEFVVLVTQLPDSIEDARNRTAEALERARKRIRQKAMPVKKRDGKRVRMTLSGGAAFYPHEGSKREDLFALATKRLQDAKKRRGDLRGNLIIYQDEDQGEEPGADA